MARHKVVHSEDACCILIEGDDTGPATELGMTRIYTPWLTTDIARLRELYPKLGTACVAQFPGRTKSQIRSYAAHLGLKCEDPQQRTRMPREKAPATVRKLMQRYGITAEEVA